MLKADPVLTGPTLNEAFWIKEQSPEVVARVRASVGTEIPTSATWLALWEASGLQDRTVKLCQIEPRKEIKDRMQWVGWRWALRGLGRLLRLYLTQSAVRQSLKEMLNAPSAVLQQMGYGLFTGRK